MLKRAPLNGRRRTMDQGTMHMTWNPCSHPSAWLMEQPKIGTMSLSLLCVSSIANLKIMAATGSSAAWMLSWSLLSRGKDPTSGLTTLRDTTASCSSATLPIAAQSTSPRTPFFAERSCCSSVKTTKFRDSMCHLASSLDSLPKMLGFSGNWKKGFFPHKFNTRENQAYVGHLPDRAYFDPEGMSPERNAAFETWYSQECQNTKWDFQENLVKYCKADVLVLARALEAYDTMMKELNKGISPLTNVTLASYALTVFRNLHMPENTLVVATEEEHSFAAKALHGGKTDVRVLYREWTPEQIDQGIYGCYVDVQSMYPFVQYTREIPCGIPEWREFDNVDLDFLRSFIGFAECNIEPIRYLHHPVIGGQDPETHKYVFDLRPKKRIVLTSAEIQVALENGYIVTKLYKALVFPQRQILFQSYIQTFLKIELEASGIPAEVDREVFSRRYRDELGIVLDEAKMKKSKGLRSMAKLMLNSLWGKLGQDPNLTQTVVIDDDAEYKSYLRREYEAELDIRQTQQIQGNKTILQFVKRDNHRLEQQERSRSGIRGGLWPSVSLGDPKQVGREGPLPRHRLCGLRAHPERPKCGTWVHAWRLGE
ncbi:DNA polymerase type B, organellar and viral-domain-containing protein [Gorgonomyces haynaldii]|nr:DNA polymerase type B, organellar and viral-domain-containing protein [Gorgonomyces haynaldii]